MDPFCIYNLSLRYSIRLRGALLALAALSIAVFAVPSFAAWGSSASHPQTQTAGGRSQPEGSSRLGTAESFDGDARSYLDDFSAAVRQEHIKYADPNPNDPLHPPKITEITAAAVDRGPEVDSLRYGVETGSEVALVLGEDGSGRTAIVKQLVLEHPTWNVKQLNMKKLAELEPKERVKAVKAVIQYVSQLNADPKLPKTILNFNNVKALAHGLIGAQGTTGSVGDRPVDAIIWQMSLAEHPPMIIEIDGATNANTFMKDKATYGGMTKVTVPSPTQRAVKNMVLKITPGLEQTYKVHFSRFVINEIARIAAEQSPANAFQMAETYMTEAAEAKTKERMGHSEEVTRLRMKIAANERETTRIKSEIEKELGPNKWEGDPDVVKLNLEWKDLKGRLTKLMPDDAPPSVEAEIAWLQRRQQELRKIADADGIKKGSNHDTELARITGRLDVIARSEGRGGEPAPSDAVSIKDIHRIASRIHKVAEDALAADLTNMGERIQRAKETVKGQDHIIDELSGTVPTVLKNRRLESEYAAFKNETVGEQGPIASGLMGGDPGTGKTEIAKQTANSTGRKLIRLDMSEYMEKHTVARIIGAPPGYVGFEEGGQLTDAVLKDPHAVVLLDEIEKAHPDVFNLLLQVLSDGRLTDGQGRTVDFRNTIVLMTTNLRNLPDGRDITKLSHEDLLKVVIENLGTLKLPESGVVRMSEEQLRSQALKLVLRQVFRPEVIDRFTWVMTTNAHTPKTLRSILLTYVQEIANMYRDVKGIGVKVDEGSIHAIINELGVGASVRQLQKLFKARITNPLAAEAERAQRGEVAYVVRENGNYVSGIAGEGEFKHAVAEGEREHSARQDRVRAAMAADTGDLSKAKSEHAFRSNVLERKLTLEYIIRNAAARALRGRRR